MGDAPERDNDPEPSHFGDRFFQEFAARLDLGRQRLVLGRNAAHRIGDARIDEGKPVIGALGIVALREAELRQRRIEEMAGKIAGERPAGAVGSPQAGRKPE